MARGQHAKPSNNKTKKIATVAGVSIGGVSMPFVMAPSASAAPMNDWDLVAKCESNSQWHRPDGDSGRSSGGLQFQPPSWNGALSYLRGQGIDTSEMPQGSGHQAYKATKDQQILAGEALLAMQGPGAWAVTVDSWGARCGAHGALSEGSLFEGGPSPFGPGADLQGIADGGKPSAKPEPAADRPEATKGHDHYTVAEDDTLSGIAEKLGVEGGWEELHRWNTTVASDPHRIDVGMELNVPKSATPPEPDPRPDPDPPASTPDDEEAEQTHTVVKGDTLWGIAGAELDAPVEWPKIHEANKSKIDDPHWIFPGQKFTIPGKDAKPDKAQKDKPPKQGPKKTYTVAENDTLSGIADRAGVNWHAVYNLNKSVIGSDADAIEVGMELRLPGSAEEPGKPPAPAPKPAGWVSPIDASANSAYNVKGGCFSRSQGCHSGTDFAASSGTPVKAVSDATVVHAGHGGAGSPYGNHVILKLDDGKHALYGHLSSSSVSEGQTVEAGQTVGLVGSTGASTGPHLHFEIRHHATAFTASNFFNPVTYLRDKGVTL